MPVARSELAAAALLLSHVLLEPAGAAVGDQHLAHWTGNTKDQLLPTAGWRATTGRRSVSVSGQWTYIVLFRSAQKGINSAMFRKPRRPR